MVLVEAATKGLQEALKRVSGRMDGQDNSQAQHEEVTSHLHQKIQAEGAAAMGRDEELGQELLDTKAQHQGELQNHERIINAMMAELEGNKEARERQESHIAELTQAVTSLMGQVRGKRSNPIPEQSAGAARGGGGGRPPPTMHGAAGGTPDSGDSEGEGSDNERRGRWDERPNKQNKNPVEKKKLMRKNMDKLGRTRYHSPGPWERPLEKPQNVQLNPHQNTNMPNTKIFGFG